MTGLQALYQALIEAQCGSRELDAALYNAVKPDHPSYIAYRVKDPWKLPDDGWRYGPPPRAGVGDALPRYTTSLDAITSLIERVLPGWAILVSWRDGYAVCDIHTHALGDFDGLWPAHESAQTPALALAKSLVSALIAQEGEK